MAKLVDRERLARLAAALDARMKATVKAEEDRAKGVEAKLQGLIDALNGTDGEGGSLSELLQDAKDYADEKDVALKALIDEAIEVVNAKAVKNEGDITAEAGAREAKDLELQAAIDLINNGDGENVKSLLQQAKDYADAQDTAMQTNINATIEEHANKIAAVEEAAGDNADAIEGLTAKVDQMFGEGSEGTLAQVEKAVKEFKEAQAQVDAAQDEAVQAAQKAADDAQADVNALEAVVGKAAAEGQEATGLVKEIADNKAAIEQEVADREAAVNAEAQARQAADQELQNAINALKGEEEGSIAAQIKAAVDAEAALREEADNDLDKAIDDEAARAAAKENEIAAAIKAEEERAMAAEKANKDLIDILNGNAEQEGSVDKKIADAIDEVNGAAEELEGRVAANEAALEVLNGAAEVVGSVAEAKAAADKAQADINAFMSAEAIKEGAVDTLKEIQEYIDTHGEAAAKMVDDIAANKAAIEAEAQAARVAEQANAAAAQAAQNAANQAQGEVDAVELRVDALEQADKDMVADQKAKDEAQDALIAANQAAAEAAQNKADANELAIEAINAAETGILDQAKAFAQAEDAKIESAFKEADLALQAAIDGLDDRMDAVEAFEGRIAANEKAIEKEVEDRNAAIEAALEEFSTTEEMKVMLGNVVNSLALTMENDKVVLKLGGVDGIAITEVSLDIVTDAEIDAMIAELDKDEE